LIARIKQMPINPYQPSSTLINQKMKPHLLYVEDDESLGFVTKDNLEMQGYEITHCTDGKSALETAKTNNFDLCILDVMLPEMDGFSLAEEIRRFNAEIPIIFLSAKSLKEDKIKGLRLGGDDYITKPFSIEELILKVEVFLRRKSITTGSAKLSSYRFGCYEFDYKNLGLTCNGTTETLTQREADLLKYFLDNPNQVVKRSDILEKLWGEDDYFMGRSLDVFISRLRKYLRNDENLKLENIHGVGFRFNM
jgi:two-component system, OmpR family, response regulator VicR